MTHESQDEDRSTKEDKSGLQGLQGEPGQEREDLGCGSRTAERGGGKRCFVRR